MYLLIESPHVPTKNKVVKSHKSGKVIFETTLQTLSDKNRNGRVYEKDAIIEALNSQMIKERMQNKTFGGELDHPIATEDSTYTQIRHTTLLFKDMSHIIQEVDISGDEVNAVIETTSTPNGFTMAGLVLDGVRVGFSLRAVGSNIKKVGDVEYVSAPIIMVAYDCVSFPSHNRAYMKEIIDQVSENTDLINEARKIHCKEGICALVEHIENYNSNNTLTKKTNTNEYFQINEEVYNHLKARSKIFL